VPTNILIVDDHPLFVEALEQVIQNTFADAAVSKATSIETARAVLDEESGFDLVLLDLSMPAIPRCRSLSCRRSRMRASSTR